MSGAAAAGDAQVKDLGSIVRMPADCGEFIDRGRGDEMETCGVRQCLSI